MKKIFKSLLIITCCGLYAVVANAAPAAKGQSVIQSGGTSVRARVAPVGLYAQECYESYYGCMDAFCVDSPVVLNVPGEPVSLDGGTCACSDESAGYKTIVSTMNARLDAANNLKTIEVEKVSAGARADIIFGDGTRQYDAAGNVITLDKKENNTQQLKSLWDFDTEIDPWGASTPDLSTMNGSKLYNGAHELCQAQMPNSCSKDVRLLTSLYSTQIKSDCAAFGNAIAKMQPKVDEEYAAAEKAVRDARLASFESANEYDRGTCMLNFRKCMNGADVCGADWANCVNFVAAENMQNNKRTSDVSRQKVEHIAKYEITDTTMEMLDSKRNICENVLDKCIAVRDNVWTDFLREVAPSLKLAELNAESKLRGSCLTDISSCIQTACRDDIENKGVASMDACLSRPDMARSFCRIQIETCERMEPLIWGYVKDKLASMRVDRCTEEVKTCFTDRCGTDFSQCVGLDYDTMHALCPLDKLVVCKQNNPNFSMNDIDSMLMGLYLNVDNAALENCQNLVETKMKEICGSTADCNRFAADDTIGTGSLQPQKDGNIYRITGMISFGNIKMGDASSVVSDNGAALKPGQIGIQEYITTAMSRNAGVNNLAGITESINAELNNIAGTINRTIELLEQDPQIRYCVYGRDMSQITGTQRGSEGSITTARFPNLLNQTKMLIAASALRKAQDNYNAKLNTAISDATKNASLDMAQYMCQKMAETGSGVADSVVAAPPLAAPYAVSYDVGAGLTAAELTRGGAGVAKSGGFTIEAKKASFSGGGTTQTINAVFSRDTRTCRICTTTMSESCSVQKNIFGNIKKSECTANAPVEKCNEIVM
jgi:hypothetical protein